MLRSLSITDSLMISVSVSFSPSVLKCMVDSGSTHCFVNKKIIDRYSLPTTSIPPIPLYLIDGSSNSFITQQIVLNVTFNSSDTFPISFLVTKLETNCDFVLGYDWLTRYNPSIDWVLGSIKF